MWEEALPQVLPFHRSICMSNISGSAPLHCKKTLRGCIVGKLATEACLTQSGMPGSSCNVVDDTTTGHSRLGMLLNASCTNSHCAVSWQLLRVSANKRMAKAWPILPLLALLPH